MLGDPRLRLKGEPVDSFGKYLHDLLDDLADTMRHAPGVGLAAPQLGEATARLRDRGRGAPVRAGQPPDRPLDRRRHATSRAACRSRATSPTSPVARRSGSSPRIAAGRKFKVAGSRPARPGPPARARPPRRQALHRLPRLDGRADPGRPGRRGRRRRRRAQAPTARPSERRHPRGDARPRLTSRARVVFLGSGMFAVAILEELLADPTVERRRGRHAPRIGPPDGAARFGAVPVAALAAAARAGAPPAGATSRDRAGRSDRRDSRPDLVVLADYGQIVPAALLDAPARGMLNLHPSLLPRHRGATPIPAAILAGDRETGVTLIRMDAGLDTGPLIATEAVPLAGTETAPGLEAALAAVAAGLLASQPRAVAARRARGPAPARGRGDPQPAAPARRRPARSGAPGRRARTAGPRLSRLAGQLPRDVRRPARRVARLRRPPISTFRPE